MKPILYATDETAFTTMGKGVLSECISCVVTEELNGIYELEFTYPITGRLYREMVENGGIIYCTHDDNGDFQAFDIYKYSVPINGIVTFNAHHISYRLCKIVVSPFAAVSCADAFSKIVANSMQVNPFSFSTDKTVNTSFELKEPISARALLGGVEGSLLDAYGKGEYKFDNFNVYFLLNRGAQTDVVIRYGKNLTELTKEHDETSIYNAVVPFWKSADGEIVYYNGTVVASGQTVKWAVPLDLSSSFADKPTTAELEEKAAEYLANNTPWIPDENITFSFFPLWQSEEYKQFANFERVKLGDTISVEYTALGVINNSAKIVKVVYNVLADRFDSIEVGKIQSSLAETILAPTSTELAAVKEQFNEYVPASGGTFTGDVNFNGKINGIGLSYVAVAGGNSYEFDMPNLDRSLFVVIGATNNNKTMLFANTSSSGSVSVKQSPTGSNVTYTTATGKLTISNASNSVHILRIRF